MKKLDDLTRIKRKVYLLAILAFIGFIGLVVWLSLSIAQVKKHITDIQPSNQTIIHKIEGPQGLSGATGLQGPQGIQGIPGTNALSTHTETTIIKEVPLQGDPGKDGVSGETPEIMVDPITCQLLTKLPSSESWNVRAQLPKPCKVE